MTERQKMGWGKKKEKKKIKQIRPRGPIYKYVFQNKRTEKVEERKRKKKMQENSPQFEGHETID